MKISDNDLEQCCHYEHHSLKQCTKYPSFYIRICTVRRVHFVCSLYDRKMLAALTLKCIKWKFQVKILALAHSMSSYYKKNPKRSRVYSQTQKPSIGVWPKSGDWNCHESLVLSACALRRILTISPRFVRKRSRYVSVLINN